MATQAATLSRRVEYISPRRQRVMGFVFLALAAGIWLFFIRTVEPGVSTTFRLTPGGSDIQLADWVFGTSPALNILAIISAVLGGYQLARGFGRNTNLVLGIVSFLFIFGFLAWAAADASLNIAGLLRTTLQKAVPITFGAMSGILSERAGVVNIAIEGMMLTGAMIGSLAGSIGRIYFGDVGGYGLDWLVRSWRVVC